MFGGMCFTTGIRRREKGGGVGGRVDGEREGGREEGREEGRKEMEM